MTGFGEMVVVTANDIRILMLAATVVVLAGCQTGGPDKAALARQFPSAAREGCLEGSAKWNPEIQKSWAKYFGIPAAKLPAFYCPRLVKGWAQGRITGDLTVEQTNKIIKDM